MLFHATYEKLLPNIKEKGLVIGSKSYNLITDVPANYFANNPDIAYSMVECAEYDDEDELMALGEIIVLAIKEEDIYSLEEYQSEEKYFIIDEQIIFESKENIFSVAYNGNIPPQIISIYNMEDCSLKGIIDGKDNGKWDEVENNFYKLLDSYEREYLRIDNR